MSACEEPSDLHVFAPGEEAAELPRVPAPAADEPESFGIHGMGLMPENHAEQDLRGASFQERDLRAANFAGANLQGANFKDAVCRAANFAVAILRNGIFKGTDLRGANLMGADLRGANFDGADLRGANMFGARVEDASFGEILREDSTEPAHGIITPWRDAPLTELETELYQAITDMHYHISSGENPSHFAFGNAYCATGDYFKAVGAAVASIGGRHGPIAETATMLQSRARCNAAILDAADKRQGRPIPGWGNSFFKGAPVPCCQGVARLLAKGWPWLDRLIFETTAKLHCLGLKIYPNPGCYTAAVGLALDCPPKLIPYIFLQARLYAWTAAIAGLAREERAGQRIPPIQHGGM